MTDDQHGEGTPRSGGRWDPLPQGDYDDGATAFVKLPEGGIDALLASADSPLAAPGHGYVPPQITAAPGTDADPSATGNWAVPTDGAQWPDPNAVPQETGGDRFTYNPASTQQWNFGETAATDAAPAAGHDVTGQWSIPVAGGDLPDESGEFTTSSLVQQWGGTPPATLPGGAAAPWATEATGQPWGQEPGAGDENAGQIHESSAGTGIAPGPARDASTGHAHESDESGHARGAVDPGYAQGSPAGRHPGSTVPGPGAHDPESARAYAADPSDPPAADFGRTHAGDGVTDPHAARRAAGAYADAPAEPAVDPSRPTHGNGGPGGSAHAPVDATQPIRSVGGPAGSAAHTSADAARPGGPVGSASHASVDPDRTEYEPEAARGHAGEQPSATDAARAAQGAGEGAGASEGARGAATAAVGAVEPLVEPSEAGPDDAGRPARPSDGPAASNAPDSPATSARTDSTGAPAPDTEAAPEPTAEDDSAPPPPDEEHPLASYVLRVNGVERPVSDAWIGESLLYVLRERLGLAGAKDGCSQGECGACNVQVDGRLVASCLVPAVTAAGSEVRTVEGLAEDGQPSDVQRALARCGAVQCGFCVPGMAMTVHDLLEGNPAPTEMETRQALCGNLCRCSGYRGVVDAVKEVVAEREAHAEGDASEQDGDEARIPHQAGPGGGGVNPSAFDSPGFPATQGPHDQAYGQDGGQA
ncbi:2Fe-2S iron-sulfur cluster-binding protein [Streptomyces sp. CA-249302]|uniref:(2Fe-2S)-binding protein n=1 Tax=Streptomyces sp. CA-249302 TaxID=3240058 RepID=UPI003D93051C